MGKSGKRAVSMTKISRSYNQRSSEDQARTNAHAASNSLSFSERYRFNRHRRLEKATTSAGNNASLVLEQLDADVATRMAELLNRLEIPRSWLEDERVGLHTRAMMVRDTETRRWWTKSNKQRPSTCVSDIYNITNNNNNNNTNDDDDDGNTNNKQDDGIVPTLVDLAAHVVGTQVAHTLSGSPLHNLIVDLPTDVQQRVLIAVITVSKSNKHSSLRERPVVCNEAMRMLRSFDTKIIDLSFTHVSRVSMKVLASTIFSETKCKRAKTNFPHLGHNDNDKIIGSKSYHHHHHLRHHHHHGDDNDDEDDDNDGDPKCHHDRDDHINYDDDNVNDDNDNDHDDHDCNDHDDDDDDDNDHDDDHDDDEGWESLSLELPCPLHTFRLGNLRDLDLSFCVSLEEGNLNFVATISKSLRSLRALYVAGCFQREDGLMTIRHIIRFLDLAILDISFNLLMGMAELRMLSNPQSQFLPNLNVLYCHDNPMISRSDASQWFLHEKPTSLRTLHS